MRKNFLFVFLMMTMVASMNIGICSANDGDGDEAYAEEQIRIAEMAKPVVRDLEYPEWGFRIHAWITGMGSETVAHVQVIDMNSNLVIKQLDRKCNYIDVIPEYSSN
ncbi:hypothetical protein SOV_48170 [Sporomusa ovata DSM 2662]|uniref:PepSY domain-containing protein n=1 Tax=Sporomusa ovata TaxID=2378 RepID=A0A0U1L1J4_9FIRM|nr:hypothetical protein [Sporomusa ovata]EQB27193.1 hypothetical protein SOV_2c00860 [Sporomusa ovata DSM 2662]CQR73033.1 hypothetical protein SpAn4DRAFT_2265 [Sporomusa ovata]